ncbi:MAG: hypothetical protein ACKOLZ_00225, partial [Verrucomicrobiota bacterium]
SEPSPALPSLRCDVCRRPVPLFLSRFGSSCPWCESARRPPRPELLAAGHPKVTADQSGRTVVLHVRSGGGLVARIWFGVSLLLLAIFAAIVFSGAEMRVNGRLIKEPGPEHYALILLLPALFTLAGVAMLALRRRLTLTPDQVRSEILLPAGLGWSERLAVHGPASAFLAFRGAKVNGRAVDAVVVSSGGKEISFGSFMEEGLKEYLVAVIADHYGAGEPSAPFLAGEDGGR